MGACKYAQKAPLYGELDRLQYEVQHRPKKKDNVNTGV